MQSNLYSRNKLGGMLMETQAAGAAAAAGGSAFKLWGIPIFASAIAIALGFTCMWPETKKEGFQRMFCALIASFFFGPVIVITIHSFFPSIFSSATALALQYGIDPALGMFFIATPVLVLPAIAAWWVFGGFVIWFEKRKGKGIDELAQDAAQAVKNVKEAM